MRKSLRCFFSISTTKLVQLGCVSNSLLIKSFCVQASFYLQSYFISSFKFHVCHLPHHLTALQYLKNVKRWKVKKNFLLINKAARDVTKDAAREKINVGERAENVFIQSSSVCNFRMNRHHHWRKRRNIDNVWIVARPLEFSVVFQLLTRKLVFYFNLRGSRLTTQNNAK